MSKQISYKIQDQWVAEQSPAIIELDYNGTIIEINPALSLQSRKDFTDLVWSMVYIGGEYLPVIFPVAVRIAALYVYTNLKIDLQDIERSYRLVQYTGLHHALGNALDAHGYGADYLELERTAKEYVQYKAQASVAMQTAIVANSGKSAIDSLVETVLENLNAVLEKFAEDNADVSAKSVIDAISKMGQLKDESALVDGVLQFHANE